jgi:hypothetical protein
LQQQPTKGKDMQISKLEVKNISYYARGSEETPCYNATVYINGKKAIEVSNEGHGGSDRQDTYPELHDFHPTKHILTLANEWCIKNYGTKTHKYMSGGEEKSFDIEMDLEHVCQDALYDWLDRKVLKKDLNAKFLCQEDKELFAYKKPKHADEDEFKAVLRNRHPKAKCLNFMAFEDALKLFKEFA